MSGDGTKGARTDEARADDNGAAAPRIRKNTLEQFNDELSLLDRPLDSEVEYYDEEPKSKRPRVAIFAGVALMGLAGGALLLPRLLGGVITTELAAAPATTTVAIAAPPPAAVVAPTPMPPPSETAPEETDDAAPAQAPAPVSRSGWSQLGSKVGSKVGRSAGPSKHAHSASHKASPRPRARDRHK